MFIGRRAFLSESRHRIMIGRRADPPTQASFDLTSGVLPYGSTFTRGTGATQFLSNGLVGWGPENLCLQSQTLDSTAWTKSGGGTGSVPVVTPNDALAPDGTLTADKVVFATGASTTAADQSMAYSFALGVTPGTPANARLYVKGTAGAKMQVRHVSVSNYTVHTFTGDWDLISFTEVSTSLGAQLEFGLRQAVNGAINNAITMWVWGAHVYRTPSANTTYVATTGTAYYGARFDRDPSTGAAWGYLAEMASANAVTFSQNFAGAGWATTNATVVGNAQVAPDGTTTAATLADSSTASAQHSLDFTSVSLTSGSVYGYSVFVKSVSGSRWLQLNMIGSATAFVNFQPSTGTLGLVSGAATNVVVRQLLNGWYRLSFQFTASATTAHRLFLMIVSGASDGSGSPTPGVPASVFAIWGMQVDTAGVGVTSYIPTAGSAVTRNQDVLTMPLTALPGWDAAQGGVVVATYRQHTLKPAVAQSALYISDGTSNNFINIITNTSGQYYSQIASGGIRPFQAGGATSAPFVRRRQAVGWQVNKQTLAVDGGATTVSTAAVALPVGMTTLSFAGGGVGASAETLNGTLESLTYYVGARSDAFITAVSAL